MEESEVFKKRSQEIDEKIKKVQLSGDLKETDKLLIEVLDFLVSMNILIKKRINNEECYIIKPIK